MTEREIRLLTQYVLLSTSATWRPDDELMMTRLEKSSNDKGSRLGLQFIWIFSKVSQRSVPPGLWHIEDELVIGRCITHVNTS